MKIERLKFQSPWDVLNRIPEHFPICFLGGTGRYAILGISFSEAKTADVLSRTFDFSKPSSSPTKLLPFQRGYMGVIPYRSQDKLSQNSNLLKIFEIKSSLVFDLTQKELFHCSSNQKGQWHIEALDLLKKTNKNKHIENSTIDIECHSTDDEYLEMIRTAINQIKSGRYYQINLLRYFSIHQSLTRKTIINHMKKNAGPYGCLFHFDDLKLASFSPEQFIEILGETIKSSPIKGTSPRSTDPKLDQEYYQDLKNSKKDHAELHIIVDLMRNDLARVCKKGTVNVRSSGEIHSFKKVHHLIAEINGRLKADLNFGDLLEFCSPGGSITGAPKKEVMEAIFEFEKRERNYFMGHCFYWDLETNHFDSSILIRTLCAKDGKNFEYAAGSGITVNSDPLSELSEIIDKCRVITEL